MSQPAITVEDLSKRYQIGAGQQGRTYRTVREAISQAASAPIRRLRAGRSAAPSQTSFWALKDISFQVQPGEVLGIIGRNGAGKSTLLKILSRITEPTSGFADMRGRVASLLEVGTGFHGELTGRENLYLNGAILGMKRSEIQRLFDEIVAFAEVEQFIDTPVKRYSSGMYLRLAFAVAAFLQPEILVVDEVLAVGDAAFQKKCLGRMGEVARDGRTVLFVSHNMAAVRSLCQTGLVLERGQILTHGPVHEAIEQYLAESADQPDECTWPDLSTAPGNTQARLRAIRLLDRDGYPIREARLTEAFFIEIDYTVLEPGTLLLLSVSLHDRQGTWVLASPNLTDENWFQKEHPKGTFRSRCAIPGNLLNEGAYNVTVFLVGRGARIIARAEQAVTINLVDLGESRGTFFGQWGGVVRPQLSWQTSILEPAPLGIAVASSHL